LHPVLAGGVDLGWLPGAYYADEQTAAVVFSAPEDIHSIIPFDIMLAGFDPGTSKVQAPCGHADIFQLNRHGLKLDCP
jgi:hypothetical protein